VADDNQEEAKSVASAEEENKESDKEQTEEEVKENQISPEDLDEIAEIRNKFAALDQHHIFNGFSSLTREQKDELLAQAQSFDPSEINRLFDSLVTNYTADETTGEAKLTPIDDEMVSIKSTLSEKEYDHLYESGLDLIREGRVGVVILAGGQGSRLGFNHPKGLYDVGLPSSKSLFQILTERFFKAQLMAHGFYSRSNRP